MNDYLLLNQFLCISLEFEDPDIWVGYPVFQWWVEVPKSGVLWSPKASVWNSPEKGEREREKDWEEREGRGIERERR